MGEEKIGIAVSLYDKFDDLAILHDILRHNFEDDYCLSVHCNHPDGREEILEERDLDIDHYSQGGEIDYRPGTQKTLRILNSIKKSSLGAMDECDYVMHVHADAWPLKEDKLNKLIDLMKEKNRGLAFRGQGNTFRKVEGLRLGQTMDQFFIFETQFFKEKDFWDFDLLDPLPHMGIHNTLMLLFLGRAGRTNMLKYVDHSEDVKWDNKKKVSVIVRPSIYNEEWGLFHCARDEFPGEYGKEVQAMRLREHSILRGQYIEKLLDEHQRSREEIERELRKIEKKQDFKLRFLLYNPKHLYREFDQKQEILDKPFSAKINIFTKNLVKNIYFNANRFAFKFLPFENPGRERTDISRGARWPKLTHEIYQEEINDSEVKADITKWYEQEN
jgi:hypothetical protein